MVHSSVVCAKSQKVMSARAIVSGVPIVIIEVHHAQKDEDN
jgi:hypothetical protein